MKGMNRIKEAFFTERKGFITNLRDSTINAKIAYMLYCIAQRKKVIILVLDTTLLISFYLYDYFK